MAKTVTITEKHFRWLLDAADESGCCDVCPAERDKSKCLIGGYPGDGRCRRIIGPAIRKAGREAADE